MPREKLSEYADKWDTVADNDALGYSLPKDPTEHEELKENQDIHRQTLEEIFFLAEFFFNEYELNHPEDFLSVLNRWIEQFDNDIQLESEARHAFFLVRNIMFISRKQILSLLYQVWDEIKMALYSISATEQGIPLIQMILENRSFENQLHSSAFIPLTEGGTFTSFRHHCLPEGDYDKLVIPTIEKLLMPIKMNVLNDAKQKYNNKINLFLIEDFSGSGISARSNIIPILKNYDFYNIFFCPLILTEKSKDELCDLSELASSLGKEFRVIYGMLIEKDYSIVEDQDSRIWSIEQKRALRAICKKYFDSHFRENAYLYNDFRDRSPQSPCPYGFKDGGWAFTHYENCPNNSLPIIWAQNTGWNPLFRRHEKHVRTIKND